MMKLIKRALLLAAALILVAGTVAGLQYRKFLETPLSVDPGGSQLVVAPGTSYRAMIRQLNAEGLSDAGWSWRLLHRLEPRLIRAGEYRLAEGMLPRAFLDKLARGDVIVHQFTIIEGWTFLQLRTTLAGEPSLVQRTAGLDDDAVMLLLGQGGADPEGRFLPETYQFIKGDSDLDILRRSWDAMDQALNAAWQSREADLPLDSPDELLILASIIEKETGLAAERPRISGVFVRRLKKRMRLQTDPTVIFGLGPSFDGDIRYRDLTTDTPYNTYTRHGLPPGPIALPGVAALQAAASPEPGTALYFVATGDGSHYFSATLEEHNRAVDRYQRKRP